MARPAHAVAAAIFSLFLAFCVVDAKKAALNPVDVPAWRFYDYDEDAQVLTRPPGTLLLNMLIKNEEVHLARTLPKWAKLPIDAWIIGVDDNNTDSSVEVIQRELGHIPGKIVTVHFEGMGPTWTKLVEAGWQYFPNITHGILADADFAPTDETLARRTGSGSASGGGFDKRELDIRCSKHIYTIVSADRSRTNSRKLDWIYRNMPGVSVKRRTHQSLHAPPMPGQKTNGGHDDKISVADLQLDFDVDVPADLSPGDMARKLSGEDFFITETPSLVIDEAPGGYQDRAGGALAKAKRYIGFLEGDLAEFGPDDSRSLYYLGIGHFDAFAAALREANNDWSKLTKEDWDMLAAGEGYMKRRTALPPSDDVGKKEERWFALLKLGEVRERYHGDYEGSLLQYLEAARSDPERADAWFYAGQNLRLRQRRAPSPSTSTADQEIAIRGLTESLAYLFYAANLPMPDRALFQWKLMYNCLPSLEMARTMETLLAYYEDAKRPLVFVTDAAEESSVQTAPAYRREWRQISEELQVIVGALRQTKNPSLNDPDAPEKIAAARKKVEALPLYLQWLEVAKSRAKHAAADCAAEGEGSMANEARQLAVKLEAALEKVLSTPGETLITQKQWRRRHGGKKESSGEDRQAQAQVKKEKGGKKSPSEEKKEVAREDKGKKGGKFTGVEPLDLVHLPGFSLLEPSKATFWPPAEPNEEVERLACEYKARFDGVKPHHCTKRKAKGRGSKAA